MAKKDSLVRAAILCLLTVSLRLDAQVIEVPIAFDSAGKVRSLTPALVARFGLRPPTWPVTDAFVQARVFRSSTGETVLVAERATGALERYTLAQDQARELRESIDSAMSIMGSRVGEDRPDMISEPARGAFLRNQMILAAVLYGPLLAAMTDDAQAGSALYLISIGGSYFALNSISKTTRITRAQNDLATDGALRGAATAAGLLRAFGGNDIHQKTYSGIALAGAISGATIGYLRGRGLTDSEAHAAMKFSTFAAGTALGIAGASGAFDSGEGGERLAAGATVAAGLAGYLLGPGYPRRASYTVTAGDVKLLSVGALLGAMAGVTPFVDEGSEQWGAASATLGGLLGIYLADRGWARPYDNGSGDVTQTWLGTIAGGLLGGAGVVLAEPDNAVVGMTLVTTGAIIGALAGHAIADPVPVRRRGAFHFTPGNAVFAATGVPGQHALLSFRF